ncbi:hypothetical protein HNQ94_000398 [Salirhabdus euzebyi]|uniref:Uncharacterized protein n=1 Tax=Salirhabdus euzebyi TaxID=394506 RepID=A0A841PSP1_9BACI|nr:hypothetical protein [Salirhabdus euzebyi]MBB6451977.1 hypothetical protein [Salirhabdus euzebyi]
MIPTANEFVKMFKTPKQENVVRFAKVDPNYTSGRPSLIFDGETAVTIKRYPYLASYTPQANDRVMLIKNVIVGVIT